MVQPQRLFVSYFPPKGTFRQPVAIGGNGLPVTPYDNHPLLPENPDQSIHYNLDPDTGAFNAEWLTIYLKNGKVVGPEYLAD